MTHHRALSALASLLFASTLLAQDPWASVPAMPTTFCYSQQDNRETALGQAVADLLEAAGTQAAINKALQKQVTSDPMAMQQKLVAALQKNPTQAPEIMGFFEKMGNATIASQSEGAGPTHTALKERAAKHEHDYYAERSSLLGPIQQRIKNTGELGRTPNEQAILKASWIEYDKKYETVLCPKFFKDAPLPLIAEYKQYILTEYIPKGLAAEANERKFLEMFGVPATDFRPVSTLKGVAMYLDFAAGVFAPRQSAAGMP